MARVGTRERTSGLACPCKARSFLLGAEMPVSLWETQEGRQGTWLGRQKPWNAAHVSTKPQQNEGDATLAGCKEHEASIGE